MIGVYFIILLLCWFYVCLNIVTSKWFDRFCEYGDIFLMFTFAIAGWIAMMGTHSFYIEWKMDDKIYNVTLNSMFN
jgi:hypothetical protein